MGKADVVIVGGGHGGAQVAAMLRQLKFDGSILLIGEEPDLPYERPPLSKEYFSGEKDFDRILLRPRPFWAERNITLRLGEQVTEVDPDAHQITTGSGDIITYGKLVWATGGSPRALPVPGATLDGVFGVRTRGDADAIRQAARDGDSVVVIGGGYIGLEAAAVLAKAGKRVTVLEALKRVLARVAGEEISHFFEAEHRAHGVDIRLNARVEAIEGEDHATGVRLADGEVIPADFVIVGIGIAPSVEPLIAAGAKGGNGVLVDEYCATSLPDIYALGDCAAHENAYADGTVIRLESVQNANDQGRTVARNLCGATAIYDAVPWFWSNQYDIRLQTIGLSTGYDETIVRGNPDEKAFSVIYLKKGRVIALDCVNAPADYAQGRLLIVKQVKAGETDLANPEIELKSLVA